MINRLKKVYFFVTFENASFQINLDAYDFSGYDIEVKTSMNSILLNQKV